MTPQDRADAFVARLVKALPPKPRNVAPRPSYDPVGAEIHPDAQWGKQRTEFAANKDKRVRRDIHQANRRTDVRSRDAISPETRRHLQDRARLNNRGQMSADPSGMIERHHSDVTRARTEHGYDRGGFDLRGEGYRDRKRSLTPGDLVSRRAYESRNSGANEIGHGQGQNRALKIPHKPRGGNEINANKPPLSVGETKLNAPMPKKHAQRVNQLATRNIGR